MTEDPEPEHNISGGESGGGDVVADAHGGSGASDGGESEPVDDAESEAADDGEAATRAEAVVDRLGELYWQKAYGGRDAFECLVRTVLSQNTSDVASQPAHDALMDRYGSDASGTTDDAEAGEGAESESGVDLVDALADADQGRLAETIAAAGLYNQKSGRLIALAEEIRDEFGGEAGFDEFVTTTDPAVVRERLLEMNGVGPKTADCVLLFAGGRGGVFPVDTHVHRIARRMGLAPPDADHEVVREHLERDVPAEKCGFGHTAAIQFGREYCDARAPACLDDPEACPLAELCDRVGVDTASGEVVDPAEAAADD